MVGPSLHDPAVAHLRVIGISHLFPKLLLLKHATSFSRSGRSSHSSVGQPRLSHDGGLLDHVHGPFQLLLAIVTLVIYSYRIRTILNAMQFSDFLDISTCLENSRVMVIQPEMLCIRIRIMGFVASARKLPLEPLYPTCKLFISAVGKSYK
ncbi:hypothetical protein PENSPDRAFT_78468 [Peniophora sp. CONT]|nr:hypothetical protein PENSPDRAFT_78468 [Peniophora sp. CONT]